MQMQPAVRVCELGTDGRIQFSVFKFANEDKTSRSTKYCLKSQHY